ncbi:MAG: ATP-binding cassette domain-containing protein, partial [Ferrovibrionaceae bacterium]
MSALLTVENLRIELTAPSRTVVDDISFTLAPGEFLALVGESGSGKTLAARAVLRLLPPALVQTGGTIRLDGEDMAGMSPERLRQVRGGTVGMVFQEPMVSLNPAHTIGAQIAEGLKLHRDIGAAEIRRQSIAMLERVKIRDAERCLAAYPHEFSG